jgi:hypothetical protein
VVEVELQVWRLQPYGWWEAVVGAVVGCGFCCGSEKRSECRCAHACELPVWGRVFDDLLMRSDGVMSHLGFWGVREVLGPPLHSGCGCKRNEFENRSEDVGVETLGH